MLGAGSHTSRITDKEHALICEPKHRDGQVLFVFVLERRVCTGQWWEDGDSQARKKSPQNEVVPSAPFLDEPDRLTHGNDISCYYIY